MGRLVPKTPLRIRKNRTSPGWRIGAIKDLKRNWFWPATAAGLLAITAGCGRREDAAKTSSPTASATSTASTPTPPPASVPVVKKRVTDRPANLKGGVPIIMYHHILDRKGRMFRTRKQFRGDLEYMYKLGFRPVTFSEYLNNKMDLPPGASPIVLTFDDSNPSQLQLRKDGSVDPDCAVGIWEDFAKDHPDFPVHGTFYVLPNTMWLQPEMLQKKLQIIRDLGSELGNHTLTHPVLRSLKKDRAEREIAVATDDLVKMGVPLPISLALPYGVGPRDRSILKGFTYNGKKYAPSATLLVGAGPAPAPTDPKLRKTGVPRILAYDGDLGVTYWLKMVEKKKMHPYVAP